MTKYRVTIIHDACTTHDVDAETEAGAIGAAMDDAHVTLCHYCADRLEVGDPIRAACVEDMDTGIHNSDADPDPEVVQLRARVADRDRLAAEVDALREALRIVADWELPPTGETLPSGRPMSYEMALGSNAAREYIRGVARTARAAIDAAKAMNKEKA